MVPINCNILFFVPKRAAERDARKAKHKEKKLHDKEETLRTAIKVSFRCNLDIKFTFWTVKLIQVTSDIVFDEYSGSRHQVLRARETTAWFR